MAVGALAKPDLVLVTYSVPMCSRVPTHYGECDLSKIQISNFRKI